MAELYGTNYTKAYVNVPAEKYSEGTYAAQVRAFTEEFELSGAVAQNDIINLFKLTNQGRVVGGFIKCDDMGVNGAFKLGIVGNDDSLVTAADVSTASGVASFFALDGQEYGELIVDGSEVILTCTETTAASVGSIKVVLLIAEA